MKSRIEANGTAFISTKIIMDKFDVSGETIKRWAKTGLLPEPLRLGKHNFYAEAEVEQRIARGNP